jgi:hypothetical protein
VILEWTAEMPCCSRCGTACSVLRSGLAGTCTNRRNDLFVKFKLTKCAPGGKPRRGFFMRAQARLAMQETAPGFCLMRPARFELGAACVGAPLVGARGHRQGGHEGRPYDWLSGPLFSALMFIVICGH